MKKHLSTILLVLMFLIGLSVLLYPAVSNAWNSRVQTKAITNYESVLGEMEQEDYSAFFEQAIAFNQKLAEMDEPISHAKSLKEYWDMLKLSGTDIMGYVAIEKIKVEIPIYHGTEDAVLAAGVGHLEGTSLPIGGPSTHCALSAHRGLPSAKLFSDLDKLDTGDTFTITVLDQLITYEIDQIRIVLPHELENLKIEEGKDYCTLVTCTPYGINTHRLLVRGHRIDNLVERPKIHVKNDAMMVNPLVVAPIVAVPVLIIALMLMSIGHRIKKKRKHYHPGGKNHEI